MILPEAFERRMNEYFDSHPEISRTGFFESFDSESYHGLRLNRLKAASGDTDRVLNALNAQTKPVPWCRDGLYIKDFPSGKDPYYHAGVYYIQEPSAMLPAEVLGAQPGDKVLDLCAAPGGKATRIGADLRGDGLLVANEISEERSRALLRNIELFGIENVVITNETPQKLEKRFASFFDRILIDAPCSGEGMFRRDRNAVRSWERYGPSSCEVLQREILTSAHYMLAPGGHLVYSTCTFGTSENEDMIDWFLAEFPEYNAVPHPEIRGVSASSGTLFTGGMRIWPHMADGDGHFCVHLKKREDAPVHVAETVYRRDRRTDQSKLYTTRTAKDVLFRFAKEILTGGAYESWRQRADGQFVLQGDKTHLLPVSPDLFNALRVVKMGAFPGEVRPTQKGYSFTPSHAFALALTPGEMNPDHVLSLCREDGRLVRYLRGETIMLTNVESESLADNACILIAVDGFSIGWGKRGGAAIKNMYPKAWRLQ